MNGMEIVRSIKDEELKKLVSVLDDSNYYLNKVKDLELEDDIKFFFELHEDSLDLFYIMDIIEREKHKILPFMESKDVSLDARVLVINLLDNLLTTDLERLVYVDQSFVLTSRFFKGLNVLFLLYSNIIKSYKDLKDVNIEMIFSIPLKKSTYDEPFIERDDFHNPIEYLDFDADECEWIVKENNELLELMVETFNVLNKLCYFNITLERNLLILIYNLKNI